MSDSEYKYANPKTPKVKQALMAELRPYDGSFAVLLSGGLDSHAVLFTLMALGKKDITVYCARMDTHESRDFRVAQSTAKTFGLKFVPIVLSSDMTSLKKDIVRNVRDMRIDSKIHVEAFWVYRKIIDTSKEKYIASGLAADLYFLVTKTACMHFKDKPDEYRHAKFPALLGPESQTGRLKEYCASVGKQWLSPWVSKRMLKEFDGTSWERVNKPAQKQPVREQFADYLEKVRIYQHTDMHKGDSGIAANFEQLLKCPIWNPGLRYKSVVGVYNRVFAGAVDADGPVRPKNRKSLFQG